MASKVVDKDKGWKEFFGKARALTGGASVKVGVLSDESAGGLHQKTASGKAKPLTVAEIAAVNEFGTQDGRIPARSFIRSTFDEQRQQTEKNVAKLVTALLFDPSMTVDKALSLLGLSLASAMKAKVVGGAPVPPPNAPSTAARKEAKGSNGRWGIRTLVDTGRMVGAISYAVVKAGVQGAVTRLGG